MLCDMLVSSSLEIADVAVWSRVRAISGILAVICLLGLDQYLLRHPGAVRRVRTILFVQIPLAALAAALIGLVFSQPMLMIVLIATFSAISVAVSQFHRSRGRLFLAQMGAQSWKVVFLFGIGYYALADSDLLFEYLIIVCAVLSLIVLLAISLAGRSLSPDESNPCDVDSLAGIYQTSVRLMMISALTTISLYLEQLVVNILGSDREAAIYFTHATYFLFSASLLNGYIAFLAIPWAKRNPDRFQNVMNRWMWQGMGVSAVYVIVVQSIAAIGWNLLSPTVGAVDVAVLVAFSISAWSRTVYTYPSAYLGAFGERDQYTVIVTRYALSLVVAAVIFVALWWGVGLPLVYSVAWASASNWMLRTIIGLRLVRLISLKKAIS